MDYKFAGVILLILLSVLIALIGIISNVKAIFLVVSCLAFGGGLVYIIGRKFPKAAQLVGIIIFFILPFSWLLYPAIKWFGPMVSIAKLACAILSWITLKKANSYYHDKMKAEGHTLMVISVILFGTAMFLGGILPEYLRGHTDY